MDPRVKPAGDERGEGMDVEAPTIVQVGDPVLRAPTAAVDPGAIRTPAMRDLVAGMVAAMRAAPGIGLAAPQVGVSQRIIVMEDRPEMTADLPKDVLTEREREPHALRVLFNPVMTLVGSQTRDFFEGCLSIKGYTAMVTRHHEVSVSYIDENGDRQEWRARGWPARVMQHEYDHLERVLYTDRMIARSFMSADEFKARYATRPIAEVKQELGIA
jgi:peptide deformylase